MGHVPVGFSSHSTTRATDIPIGMARWSLSGPHCSRVVSDEGVESYLITTSHPLVDRYGQVGRALCPYSSGLGVHAGELLEGSQPGRSPNGSVSVRSLAVSSSHAHVIRPSVWPTPLASPPSPDRQRRN